MNEGQLQILGRRARRCAGWRWMPGMHVIRPRLGGAGGMGITPTHYRLVDGGGWPVPHEWGLIDIAKISDDTMLVPDLRDPATLGCLLALVRDAVNDPALCIVSYHVGHGRWQKVVWSVDATDQQWQQKHRLFDLPSEAEALVAALEAAGGGA